MLDSRSLQLSGAGDMGRIGVAPASHWRRTGVALALAHEGTFGEADR
ncbi:MAG: hypothetical protein ABIS17_17370 [Casimicrobiaceae bacterium]